MNHRVSLFFICPLTFYTKSHSLTLCDNITLVAINRDNEQISVEWKKNETCLKCLIERKTNLNVNVNILDIVVPAAQKLFQ